MKLFIIEDKKKYDVTDKATNLSYTASDESVASEISFDVPYSAFDTNYQKRFKSGSTWILERDNGTRISYGVIVETPVGESFSYHGYDYAWYLTRSEETIQFNKISASKAIKQLLNKYDVPIGSIPNLSTTIKKIYKDMVVYDIILDILKKVKAEKGTAYRVEMRNGKFSIVKKGYKTLSKIQYKDRNGDMIDCQATAVITGKRTIENMYNSVVVAGSGEKSKQIKASAKDNGSIKKYGLLTLNETVDSNFSKAKAQNKAKTLLANNNYIEVEFTAEMVGNWDVMPNVKIPFKDGSLSGDYRVKSVTHTITQDLHKMSVELIGKKAG